jgi:hypothetical protein
MDMVWPIRMGTEFTKSPHRADVRPLKLAWQESAEGAPSTIRVMSTLVVDMTGLVAITLRFTNEQAIGAGASAWVL